MSWLFSVYLGSTIFGVGVLLVDILGLLGHEQSPDSGGDAQAGSDEVSAESSGNNDADALDSDSYSDIDTDATDNPESDTQFDASAEASLSSHEVTATHLTDSASHAITSHGQDFGGAGNETAHAVSTVMHDKPIQGSMVFKTLTILRSAVYFCAGFGPVGLFAWLSKLSPISSLMWSIPTGIASIVITRLLMRLFKKEIDSTVKEHELLMEHGIVTVSIEKGEIGKVRINLGSAYIDRYAKAKNPNESIPLGSSIYVCDIEEDCLIVEKEGE